MYISRRLNAGGSGSSTSNVTVGGGCSSNVAVGGGDDGDGNGDVGEVVLEIVRVSTMVSIL